MGAPHFTRRRAVWAGVALATAILGVLFLWLSGRAEPRPWQLAGPQPSREATEFKISIDSGRCHPPRSALERVEVDEEGDRVTVTPYVTPAGSEDGCLSLIRATVELAAPLGDRALFQGEPYPLPVRESPSARTH